MTHPYKPTIFALNTHKLDVLPDPKDRARSIEIRRQRHLASLLRDRATDAPEVGHRRAALASRASREPRGLRTTVVRQIPRNRETEALEQSPPGLHALLGVIVWAQPGYAWQSWSSSDHFRRPNRRSMTTAVR